jgi:hypothetical protein
VNALFGNGDAPAAGIDIGQRDLLTCCDLDRCRQRMPKGIHRQMKLAPLPPLSGVDCKVRLSKMVHHIGDNDVIKR